MNGAAGPQMPAVAVAAGRGGRVLAAVRSGNSFRVDVVTPNGPSTPIAFGPPEFSPLSLVAGATGAMYVLAADIPTEQRVLIAFDAADAITAMEPLALPNAVAIDLAADQCTLWIAAGNRVARHNVCTATPLTDFTAAPFGITGVRILPDGGALVLRSERIERYSAAGVLLRTYAESIHFGAIALADGGTRAIAATWCTEEIYTIDLASGVATRVGQDLFALDSPRSIVSYDSFTAAIGAARFAAVPTASEAALLMLAALLTCAAIVRMR